MYNSRKKIRIPFTWQKPIFETYEIGSCSYVWIKQHIRIELSYAIQCLRQNLRKTKNMLVRIIDNHFLLVLDIWTNYYLQIKHQVSCICHTWCHWLRKRLKSNQSIRQFVVIGNNCVKVTRWCFWWPYKEWERTH